jgi:hypothetical protein
MWLHAQDARLLQAEGAVAVLLETRTDMRYGR